MPITLQQLLQILPNAGQVAGVFVPVLNTAMNRYQIVGQKRMAAFIAQVGHESGHLARLVENLNYSADGLANTWPSRYAEPDGKGEYVKVQVSGKVRNKPNTLALSVDRKPEQIANIVYGNRMGNTEQGDGWKYRGRGLIQITGKNNYRACGDALGLDLITQPELLEKPQHACMSAAWFWATNGLNTLADAGKFDAITQRINGGQNGSADRQALYARALKVLA
ncbi:glycoside hydrolase family 19 protein [Pseudomonas sp. CCI3.1]|uniref:glycoside hydrolase family 19 protein n=1 Tax=Pseudomonas sp. CCI3.1 TaxID=3048618 RepID=UPI002AB45B38|nr:MULTISPECIES: glycoside hydrolase family 19 protein [unclassified Pseudomonas]MDY7584972.1 glycoside hydrolase family 19 protein [Pseudomonas sp. CCI3.1]MEB0066309.1 glycoside hydrolase family 19 protein [Pseudomonas sp. CCI3.1]MEB0071627.1 glycoside hydrolase family 19 protein [Pseudomonas sp. CCI1.4]